MLGKSSLTLLRMTTVDSWATADVIGNSGKAAFFFKNDNRARIFKRLWSPGIDSKELIPPAYVAWRAGTITLFLLGAWPP
jgi:hypothetical protein